MKRLPTTIPRTQEEIQHWLEGLLSKQYDTEETAVHAVEEYRDLVVATLEAKAVEIEDWGRKGAYVLGDQSACAALREFAASLGGMGR